jgi:hypothetical protein
VPLKGGLIMYQKTLIALFIGITVSSCSADKSADKEQTNNLDVWPTLNIEVKADDKIESKVK